MKTVSKVKFSIVEYERLITQMLNGFRREVTDHATISAKETSSKKREMPKPITTRQDEEHFPKAGNSLQLTDDEERNIEDREDEIFREIEARARKHKMNNSPLKELGPDKREMKRQSEGGTENQDIIQRLSDGQKTDSRKLKENRELSEESKDKVIEINEKKNSS